MERRGREQVRPPFKMGKSRMNQVWIHVRKGQPSRNQGPQTKMANIGSEAQELIPKVKVETIRNGWLYRSVVALNHGPSGQSPALEEKSGCRVTESQFTYGTSVPSAALAISKVK
ncbi:hypothetical protein Dimus_023228 [Dionaea muscipula]